MLSSIWAPETARERGLSRFSSKRPGTSFFLIVFMSSSYFLVVLWTVLSTAYYKSKARFKDCDIHCNDQSDSYHSIQNAARDILNLNVWLFKIWYSDVWVELLIKQRFPCYLSDKMHPQAARYSKLCFRKNSSIVLVDLKVSWEVCSGGSGLKAPTNHELQLLFGWSLATDFCCFHLSPGSKCLNMQNYVKENNWKKWMK